MTVWELEMNVQGSRTSYELLIIGIPRPSVSLRGHPVRIHNFNVFISCWTLVERINYAKYEICKLHCNHWRIRPYFQKWDHFYRSYTSIIDGTYIFVVWRKKRLTTLMGFFFINVQCWYTQTVLKVWRIFSKLSEMKNCFHIFLQSEMMRFFHTNMSSMHKAHRHLKHHTWP